MSASWIDELRAIAAGWKYGDYVAPSPLGSSARSFEVEIEDGVRIYVEDTEADKPALLFLYGLGCAISHWKHQIRYFAGLNGQRSSESPKYRIIWMDFRGHGRSKGFGHADKIKIATLVSDIKKVMEARAVRNATILGQSMGGTIALAFAAAHPELTDRLVLQGSPPVSPTQTINMNRIGISAWRTMIRINSVSPFLVRLIYKGLPKIGRPMMEAIRVVGFNPHLVSVEDVKEYTEALIASNPNIFWSLAKDLEGFDIGQLPEIRARTLIIAGRQDNCVTPQWIDYLANHLPNSKTVFIDHGSHCPHLDDPPLVNQLIDTFLKTEE